jgi:hypothetical protein
MKIEFLILHCTATKEGREVTSDEIRRWHMSPPPAGRGWSRVGYTDLIHLDGSLENLTPYDSDDDIEAWELTNGVSGKNSISRHIVYAGGVDSNQKPMDTRTIQQLLTMQTYCKFMVIRYPNIKIAGHNQFAAKACPSFDTVGWLRAIGIPEKNIYVTK